MEEPVYIDLSNRCAADIMAKLLALKGKPLRDSVIVIMSEDDFKAKAAQLTTPFAGIDDSGLRADQGADSSRQGMFGRLIIVVIFGVAALSGVESSKMAWNVMATARNAIRMQTSPTGHKWRFEQEMYFEAIGGVAYYTQTWSTGAPLTGTTG